MSGLAPSIPPLDLPGDFLTHIWGDGSERRGHLFPAPSIILYRWRWRSPLWYFLLWSHVASVAACGRLPYI